MSGLSRRLQEGEVPAVRGTSAKAARPYWRPQSNKPIRAREPASVNAAGHGVPVTVLRRAGVGKPLAYRASDG
jgi:hypothetical protein